MHSAFSNVIYTCVLRVYYHDGFLLHGVIPGRGMVDENVRH